MKKLFLILLLLSCGFLYAETKTYRVGDSFEYSFEKPDELVLTAGFWERTIEAVLPYSQDYIVRLSIKNDSISFIYIYKNFAFYSFLKERNAKTNKDIYTYYECKVIDIKPNEFTVDMKIIE